MSAADARDANAAADAAAGAAPATRRAHATGLAVFGDDRAEIAGMLHVAPGLSPIAAGRLTRLDLEAVRAAPGVVAVLTAADIPGANDSGSNAAQGEPIIAAQPMFQGQVLFAVVARSRAEARLAVPLARIAAAAALPVADIEDAIAAEGLMGAEQMLTRGDADAEIAACDRRLIGQLRIGGQGHFALEPQTMVALPQDGGFVVRAATDDPASVQRVVAAMLGIRHASVSVEIARLGGRTGSSPQWAALAALAAWRTGRPCKLRLDRIEELVAGGRRPDFRANYSVGYSDTGLVKAAEMALSARCGFAEGGSAEAVGRALLAADNAYFIPALRLTGRRLRTNTAPVSPIRGAGAEGALVAERMMDHIAASLALDPLDVRKLNLYGDGRDRTPYDMAIDDHILGPLVTELERSSGYRRRRREVAAFNQASPILRRGLALAPFKYGVGSMRDRDAVASVHLRRDGSVRFSDSGVEAGQGLESKATALVAATFGLPPGAVTRGPTTTDGPIAPAASSLDATLLALLGACRIVKDGLHDFIEATMGFERERVAFRDGEVRLGGRTMSFAELVDTAAVADVPLSAVATHREKAIGWDAARMAGRPFHYHVHGAACAEVTIDVMTGEMRLDRVDILQDVGRSLDPAVDLGQIEGGFAFGLGWLTTEDLAIDSSGRLLNNAASSYLVPTAADVPADFRVGFFQSSGNREDTASRSKDVGDAAVLSALSVFCAIGDAIGSLRPGAMPRLSVPATPEAVMRAIRGLADGDAPTGLA